MVSVKSLIPACAAALISTTAGAADLSPPMYQPPPPVVEASGWYLRGDVGIGVQTFQEFDLAPASSLPATWTINQTDIQDTTILGFGIGYELNSWLRFDVTGEYRTKAGFDALGSYTGATCNGGGGGICFDRYSGNYSAAVFMANAYIDLGTWWCLTPYIGGGVGAAYDRITDVTDLGIIGTSGTTGFGYTYSDSASWNLAWNAQAGLTYNVSNNFKIDFNWRYLNMGSPQSANIYCQNTASCVPNTFTLKDITSQDFRIGVRWMLQPDVVPVLPPVMSRG
ncbi:MAG TPA: outer membrane beta-barrel protein [Xanthobacteraceae bacterium]|nr:outer membrane beta-barrel protein [Xanthobacteraceae bacterium]